MSCWVVCFFSFPCGLIWITQSKIVHLFSKAKAVDIEEFPYVQEHSYCGPSHRSAFNCLLLLHQHRKFPPAILKNETGSEAVLALSVEATWSPFSNTHCLLLRKKGIIIMRIQVNQGCSQTRTEQVFLCLLLNTIMRVFLVLLTLDSGNGRTEFWVKRITLNIFSIQRQLWNVEGEKKCAHLFHPAMELYTTSTQDTWNRGGTQS